MLRSSAPGAEPRLFGSNAAFLESLAPLDAADILQAAENIVKNAQDTASANDYGVTSGINTNRGEAESPDLEQNASTSVPPQRESSNPHKLLNAGDGFSKESKLLGKDGEHLMGPSSESEDSSDSENETDHGTDLSTMNEKIWRSSEKPSSEKLSISKLNALREAHSFFRANEETLNDILKRNQLAFVASRDDPQPGYCFYKSALPQTTDYDRKDGTHVETGNSLSCQDYIDHLKSISEKGAGRIAIFMIGGGHFAGMLVDPSTADAGSQLHYKILLHKTFHRYTTRRKQGGSQAAADEQKGGIHSAGSSLRRYNEKALEIEVRQLLFDWKDEIKNCSVIFVRSASSHGRRTLFDFDESPLVKCQHLVKKIPFTTYKATKPELLRCIDAILHFHRFSFVQLLLSIHSEGLGIVRTERRQLIEQGLKKEGASPPSREKSAEQLEEAIGSSVFHAVKRNKASQLMQLVQRHKLDVNDTSLKLRKMRTGSTLLHAAAQLDSPNIIAILLRNCANPCITDSNGDTPYTLAETRSSQDAFRQLRYELGNDYCDWDNARVGSLLSPSQVKQREAAEIDNIRHEEALLRQEERAKQLEQLRRLEIEEEEERRKEKDARAEQISRKRQQEVGQQRLGGGDRSNSSSAATAGLNDDMKRRIEREKRAAAAMARMQKMQAKF